MKDFKKLFKNRKILGILMMISFIHIAYGFWFTIALGSISIVFSTSIGFYIILPNLIIICIIYTLLMDVFPYKKGA